MVACGENHRKQRRCSGGILARSPDAASLRDTALKFKGTRDDESIAMPDMIVGSRVFDMGCIYSGGMGPGFALQQLFTNDDINIASHLAANASTFEEHYAKVFASFEQE